MGWETIGGFQLKAGSIFDALKRKGMSYRLYAGDDFPMVAALKGISLFDIHHYSDLAADLDQSTFPYGYVFVEPSYAVLNEYRNSTSRHPLTDVTSERLDQGNLRGHPQVCPMEHECLDHHLGRTRRILRPRDPTSSRGTWRLTPKRQIQPVRLHLRTVWSSCACSRNFAADTEEHDRPPAVRSCLGSRHDRGGVRAQSAHCPRPPSQQPASTAFVECGQGGCADDLGFPCRGRSARRNEYGRSRLGYVGRRAGRTKRSIKEHYP